MFSEQQLENLKVLIRESGALSLAEQEEWLGLLPFMNDKQLASLEALLANYSSKASARLPVAVNILRPQVQKDATALSAVAELPVPPRPPKSMLDAESMPKQAPLKRQSKSVTEFLAQNFETPKSVSELDSKPVEVSPVHDKKLLKQDNQVKAVIDSGDLKESLSGRDRRDTSLEVNPPKKVIDHPPVPKPLPELTTGRPLELAHKPEELGVAIQPPPGPAPEVVVGKPLSPLPRLDSGVSEKDTAYKFVEEPIIKLSGLEDVKKLNIATLRGIGVVNLTQKLKDLANKYGYFATLFILEGSPIYEAYLTAGIKALREVKPYEEVQSEMEKTEGQYLTKPEFEAFIDMLRKMRLVG